VFALTLTATLIIVHRALALPRSGRLSDHFLATWAATWGGSLLLLSIVAGLVVFQRSTPWEVVLTWPWLVGIAVGAGWMGGLTGQVDAGSRLCDAPANGSCDTAWGLGAAFISLAAGLVLGGSFIAAASLRRLAAHLRRTHPRTG
jgi:hypothetical protein